MLIILLIGLFIFSLLVTALMMRVNIVDYPTHRSSHSIPIPRTGGIAVIIGFIVGLTLFHCFYDLKNILSFSGYLPFVGIFLISSVSLIDDIKGLCYKTRITAHICGAIFMVAAGFYIQSAAFAQTFFVVTGEQLLTVFFIVFLINACNFIDGLNGLLSGVFLIELVFLGCNQLLFPTSALYFISFIILSVVPALLGFFYFNFKPWTKTPRIFLGDCGSTFLGSLLALLALATQCHPDPYGHFISPHFISALLPLSLLWFDVGVTLLKRLYFKKPLTKPARDYLFHLLNRSGWSHESVSFIYFFMTFIFGCLSLCYAWQQEHLWKIILIISGTLIGFAVFVHARVLQKHKSFKGHPASDTV